jgi:hypothetical protein
MSASPLASQPVELALKALEAVGGCILATPGLEVSRTSDAFERTSNLRERSARAQPLISIPALPAAPRARPRPAAQDGAALPADRLPALQRGLCRERGAPRAGPLPARSQLALPSGALAAVVADLAAVAAPAALASPTLARRRLPGFRVALRVRAAAPLGALRVGVKAYAVDEAAAADAAAWLPPPPGAEALLGGEAEGVLAWTHAPLAGAGGADGAAGEHLGAAELAFPDLAFAAPSHMRPRWLVFAAPLPGGPLLFVHVLLPTIAICRPTDQERKAAALLRGEAPAPPPSAPTFAGWAPEDFARRLQEQLHGAFGIARRLTGPDVAEVAARVGFPAGAADGAGPAALEHFIAL